jgi:lipid A 4'-phosphatase
MERVGLGAIVAVATGVGVGFAVNPHLDLHIAVYFHRLFAAAPDAAWYGLIATTRDINRHLTFAVLALTSATLAIKFVWPQLPMLMPPRITVLVFVTILLAPGLLVNGLLKENWGRPRPGETVELKGSLDFKPWWDASGECRSNCSFASGEAAGAFALLSVAAAVPAPWTAPAIVATVAFATVVGIGRVATTGHFVTDVVFGGLLSALVVWLLHGLLFRWQATRLSDADLDLRLTRLIEGGRRRTVAVFARMA